MQLSHEFKAGLFLIIASIVFICGIWILGSERQIFSKQASYYTKFSDVQGLAEGAQVRIAGINVGRVEKIGFAKDPKDPLVKVNFLINKNYLDRIQTDSHVTIETQGLLGDKFLSLYQGNSGQSLSPNMEIPSIKPADLSVVVDRAAKIVENTVQISEKINNFVDKLDKETMSELQRGISSLSNVLQNVEKGDGLLHHLVYGNSPENLTAILHKVNQAADNFKKASESLSSGSGTIGALLVDSKLYDNLVEVTDGAKRSFILRQAIKSSLEKK